MAVEYYDTAFSKKSIPEDIPELLIEVNQKTVADIITELIKMDFIKSKSEFIRLIKQGCVQLNSEKLTLDDMNSVINSNDVMKIGKKRFLKFVAFKN